MQRRRFKQSAPLDQRLHEQAERLRKEAQNAPHGVKHDKLADQTDTASHIQQWLASPGLQPPT